MEKGRVIILGGCPRAGKTTLAVKLVKSGLGFSKISLDHLSGGLSKFSEISITDWLDREKVAAKLLEFVQSLLGALLEDAAVYGINYIFDQYDFSPVDIEKLPFKDKLDVYFLGFPDISAEEIKYNIKHYAKPTDWIAGVDEEYLGVVAKRIYDYNIVLKEQCEKYSYRFVNTGVGEERDVVLDSLYEEIIKKTEGTGNE